MAIRGHYTRAPAVLKQRLQGCVITGVDRVANSLFLSTDKEQALTLAHIGGKGLAYRVSAEEVQVFNAFTEGHAVYVTEKIADRLKLSEMARKLSVKSAAGITDENNRMQQQVFHNTYVLGSKFVETIIGSKGPSIIAKVFAAPPASTRQIMHPAEYLDPSIVNSLDCVALLQKVTGEFPIEGMRSQSIDVGPMTMRTILVSQGITEKEAIDISDDFINGAIMSAVKQTLKPSAVTAFILNFANRNAATKFEELMKRVEKSGEAQFNAKLNASYNVINDEKLELDGYDSGDLGSDQAEYHDISMLAQKTGRSLALEGPF